MARSKKAARKAKEAKRPKRTKEEWDAMKLQNPELGNAGGYKLAPKANPTFEKFYQGIGIVPEEEWDQFIETMKTQLPVTFRITGSRNQAQELLKIIKGQYFTKFFGEESGDVQAKPQSLPWYHDELAWQLDITKKQIKNDNTLKSLHGFLISETESGNISRQEAVSMIPPLLMDIKPHHKILDLCAAPGSKTAQLIEMLHSDETQPIPEGFVVANDMDNKRCYLMTHQVKRIQSPNCMIINHDARILPNMRLSAEEDAPFLRYDRILCDVPCSGDGTMRKNPDIWKKWHVNGGYNLHRIQKKVLQRGLELLAVGGRLVYSTCSLNPVENEAVILTLIKQCRGTVELVDVSDQLPGLKYCKGTYSWKIMAKDGSWYETVDSAPKPFQASWDSTMYPPIITEAQDAKLERCIRILPHQQNTGAFFIAVLQKTQELPWTNKSSDPVINPQLQMDSGEAADPQSAHFQFGVRAGSGLYMFAKCLICECLLQGQHDYKSHKQGRKHSLRLAKMKELGLITANVGAEKDSENKSQEQDTTTTATSDKTANTNGDAAPVSVSVKKENVDTETAPVAASNSSATVTETAVTVTIKRETAESVVSVKEEPTEAPEASKAGLVPMEEGKGDAATDIKMEATSEGATQGEKRGHEEEEGSEPPAKKHKRRREKKDQNLNPDGGIPVKMQGHKEDPFYFCSPEDPIWPDIKEFYQVSDDLNVEQIMYRNMKRILYFVSKPVRQLVIANHRKVKFINLGVKCFSNAPSPLVPTCDYRLSQEGLLAVEQYIQGRRVCLSKMDLVTILSQENPFICKLSARAQDEVYSMGPGSALFYFKPSESDPEPNVEIVFCGWRGKTSVRSFVGKDERSHYLRMCGVELTEIQAKVLAEKSVRSLEAGVTTALPGSATGTETPMGVPSGDEEEVAQWNKGEEAPRGMEEDETEENEAPGRETEAGNEATGRESGIEDGDGEDGEEGGDDGDAKMTEENNDNGEDKDGGKAEEGGEKTGTVD